MYRLPSSQLNLEDRLTAIFFLLPDKSLTLTVIMAHHQYTVITRTASHCQCASENLSVGQLWHTCQGLLNPALSLSTALFIKYYLSYCFIEALLCSSLYVSPFVFKSLWIKSFLCSLNDMNRLFFIVFNILIFTFKLTSAKKLVRNAIHSGIMNDLGSGHNIDLCVITREGADYIRPYEDSEYMDARQFYLFFWTGLNLVYLSFLLWYML